MPIERTAASSASRGETVTASNFDAGARACALCSRMLHDDHVLGTHKAQHLDDFEWDVPDERVVPPAGAHRQHSLTDTEPVAVDVSAGEKSPLGPVAG